MGRTILTQNPHLQHAARLAIGRPFGQTRDNADNGRPIKGGDPLPQDAAVHVWPIGLDHRVLGASEHAELNARPTNPTPPAGPWRQTSHLYIT